MSTTEGHANNAALDDLVLLPQPRQLTFQQGEFAVAEVEGLNGPAHLETPERIALDELQALLKQLTGRQVRVAPSDAAVPKAAIVLRIDAGGDWPGQSPECYHLRITPQRVELVGRTATGLLQGIRTLLQIGRSCGRRWACVSIVDYPSFAVRGFYYDVSRGKVPTVDTLKKMVDRLAGLKVNQFQIYVEHVFAFAFDPEISRGCSPLTADDIRGVDAYCRDRRIDFVPSLASFGHMGRVLSLPAYRELAEIETAKSWADMTWADRVRGLTLDSCNTRSRDLVEKMYAEYVPLFSSKLMNACADETFDLGKGRNQARAAGGAGTGRLYVDHIKWLGELCARYGKRMMIWGDVVKQHPEFVSELPEDTILLNWLYGADSDYQSTALFAEAGLETYACPGCSGWNRFVNGINNADLNIRRFSAAGVRYGSHGFLNTDWGDEGHVNFLACSWHPVVLGAAMGWNEGAPAPDAFDRAFDFVLFGRRDGRASEALRHVARAGDRLDQWRVFYAPFDDANEHARMGAEPAAQAEHDGRAAAELFDAYRDSGCGDPQDSAELAVACRFVALTGWKVRLAQARHGNGEGSGAAPVAEFADFAAEVRERSGEFESLWMGRNRRSELDRVLGVFNRVAEEAEQIATQ
ncbi:MAG: family 20 glycosylhydrolase [Phycisphaerales bacterium]|nr:MAG: family 20 glycosylhydrolase [Phycisphaerales bacterium]